MDKLVDNSFEEDNTVLQMSQRLDEHTNLLRKSVLESYCAMRNRIIAQAAEQMEAEREKSREHERQLVCQIDKLQILLDNKNDDLLKERTFNAKLLQTHQQQIARLRVIEQAKESFREWRDQVRQKKYREKISHHLQQVNKRAVERQVLHQWRVESMETRHNEIVTRLESDFKQACAKLNTEHATSQNQMKLEMLSLKEQLHKEEERRGLLEEKLKGAFMRGVCALNMEAMTVLKNAPGADDTSIASLLQGFAQSSSSSDTLSMLAELGTDRLMTQQAAVERALAEAGRGGGGGGGAVPQTQTHRDVENTGVVSHSTILGQSPVAVGVTHQSSSMAAAHTSNSASAPGGKARVTMNPQYAARMGADVPPQPAVLQQQPQQRSGSGRGRWK